MSFLPILSRRRLAGLAVMALICNPGAGQTRPENLFQRHCADLAQDAENRGAIVVSGNDGWLFLASELRHIGAEKFWGADATRASRARAYSAEMATKARPETADPLPAILDFNAQLKKIGVKLIIVPVPPKAVIYPEMLPGFTNGNGLVRLDAVHQEFYALLRSNDVNVLDLTDIFLKDKSPYQGLYCRQDSHWSGIGCVLAAEKIAGAIRPLLATGNGPTNVLKSQWQEMEITGDLWQALNDKNVAKEKLRVRKIGKPGPDEPVEPDTKSRIILLGDSHNLVFHAGDDMQTSGAGLPDQLAFELGQTVDLIAVRGSGATPARINLMRRARQNENYWKNKKCVVWCFSAREFTESDGWRKVPIE